MPVAQTPLTAKQVAARIQALIGPQWDATAGDGFQAGSSDAVVKGIVTAWTPSLDVLRGAVAAGANMIITRECAFWSRETEIKGYSGAGVTATRRDMAADPTFMFKQAFIEEHGLVLFRLSGNWDARPGDPQGQSLAAALGWAPDPGQAGGRFTIPSQPLGSLVSQVRSTLGVHALRVLGDPAATVRTLALTHGFLLVPEVQRLVREAPADVIVAGEPVEWEALPYVADLITAGRARGMILLGHAVSEEPGSAAVAQWLKSVVPEVSVSSLAAGEPFWTPPGRRRGSLT